MSGPGHHSTPAPALAQTSLLSFLVGSPLPTLVLPLSPLLDALLARTARSPLRTPVWPLDSSRKASPSNDERRAAAAVAAEDPSVLLGSIESLNVKTPLGVPESSSGNGGDYFSLVTEAATMPSPIPSSHSSSSFGAATTTGALPAETSATQPEADVEVGNAERMRNSLKPVYRNEAWRSLEAGTRRNSAAPQKAAASSSMPSRNRRQSEGDVLMRGDSYGSRGSGSRGGSPLGTVEEEQYDMQTDDEDDEPWQSAYGFLQPEEQTQLLHFVLDCLERDDSITAFLPAPFSPPASSAFGQNKIPYTSPSSISPGSSPTPQFDSYTPRWTQPDASQTFTFNQGTFTRGPSFVAGSNTTSAAPQPGRTSRSNSPSSPSSTPNVCRIDNYVISATIVPVPPEAYPPSGFVVLTGPPPSPPPAAPSAASQGWLPSKWPSRPIYNSNSTSTSVSTVAATSSVRVRGPLEQSQAKYSAFESPAAGTSSSLPSLPRGPEEIMDPYLAALGNGEMARLIRGYRWENSPLGPISEWPAELKGLLSCMLASPYRECILYGPEMIMIYNDRYIETAGVKHPDLLGMPASEGWAELWEGLDAVTKRTLAGETVSFNEHFLAMERHGFSEETYHTFSYVPIIGVKGTILGIHNVSIEASATVIAARRLATMRDLVQLTSMARTIEEFSGTALKSLSTNPFDIPFCMLYTVDEVSPKMTKKEVRLGFDRSSRTTIKLTCRGSTGVPENHPFLIKEALVDVTPAMSRCSSASTSTGTGSTTTALDFRDRLDSGSLSPGAAMNSPAPSTSSTTSTSRFGVRTSDKSPAWTWPFEEACLKRDPVVVEDLGSLAESLDRSKGWAVPTRQAVVIPVLVEAGQTVPSAVLVIGVNALNRYDQLMETFFNLVARSIGIGYFSVLAAEKDRARADELVKLDKAKSNFFSSVSHELRTPLTLILGPLDDMLTGPEKEKLDKQQKDKLILVNRHANRLLSMVNKLLDFSSIEGGRMSFKYRPCSIGALTRDLAVLFRDAIERTKIEYVIDCDDDPPDCLPVYLSPDVWEKVIFNLVSNALKYSVKGKITVTLRSTRGEAVLSVSDTGIGVPQAELGKIFDRFHRIEANSRMATGSGIGLALTLELVKLVGGQLEVESEVGKGSTFIVRLQRGHTHLPFDQIEHTPDDANVMPVFSSRNLAVVDEAASWRYDADIEELVENLPSSSSSSSSPSSESDHGGNSSTSGSGEDYLGSADVLSLKNRTIVIVDDSRDLRHYMSSLLQKQFTVVQFGDPREALNFIQKHPPSLVLTDAMMPYLSGMELTTAIRRNPATALVPIIMVSAQAGNEARAVALEGGLDDYLVKPFQARELVARVRVHLQLGLMRVELEKRVEERTRALIESEARNRALAERYSVLSTVSPVGIISLDVDGTIQYANPRWHDISSAPLHPLEAWKDTVVDEDWPKVEKLWTRATKEGVTSETDDRQFRFKNGRWAQLEIRASDEVGLHSGYVGALTDITKQKEIELLHIREVEQRAADAEQTRINTEMFLDMSSHELRNPLSGVWQNAEVVAASLDKYIDFLEELQDDHQPTAPELEHLLNEMQENVEAVDSILLCASHQQRIADDILSISKLNMGLLTVQPIPFELVKRMNDVLRVFEVECSQKSIQLKINADTSIERLRAQWVKADPSRLHQILLNFLSNSIKYTSDAPKRKITVHIQAFETQPPLRQHAMRVSQPPPNTLDDSVWIVISVEDSGRGLSEEELKRLFARFSQANPRSDQYGGSGLGLYVSKKLIELHSGFIEVESRLGTGSIFSFSIPAQRAGPPTSPIASPPPVSGLAMAPTARPKRPTSSAGADGSKPASFAKRPLTSPVIESTKASKTGRMSVSPAPVDPSGPARILVVEDNLINQKVLLRQLKGAGFEVTVANNGQEALDELAKDDLAAKSEGAAHRRFATTLCDIEMPVMGGLEAIQKQRAREQRGEISWRYPVCALTGNARQQQIESCLNHGFDRVLTKPYKFDAILDVIRTLSGTASPSSPLPSRASK